MKKNNKGFVSTVVLYSTLLIILFIIFYIMYFLSMGKATSDYILNKSKTDINNVEPSVIRNIPKIKLNILSNDSDISDYCKKNNCNNLIETDKINYELNTNLINQTPKGTAISGIKYDVLYSYDSDDGTFSALKFAYLGALDNKTILFIRNEATGYVPVDEISYYELHKYNVFSGKTITSIRDIHHRAIANGSINSAIKTWKKNGTTYYVFKRGYSTNDSSDSDVYYTYSYEDDLLNPTSRFWPSDCNMKNGYLHCPSDTSPGVKWGSSSLKNPYSNSTGLSNLRGKYIQELDDSTLEKLAYKYCNDMYFQRHTERYTVFKNSQECKYKLIYKPDNNSNKTDVLENDGKKSILMKIDTTYKDYDSRGNKYTMTHYDYVSVVYNESDISNLNSSQITDEDIDGYNIKDPSNSFMDENPSYNLTYNIVYLNIDETKEYEFEKIEDEYKVDNILIYTNTSDEIIKQKIADAYKIDAQNIITIDESEDYNDYLKSAIKKAIEETAKILKEESGKQ